MSLHPCLSAFEQGSSTLMLSCTGTTEHLYRSQHLTSKLSSVVAHVSNPWCTSCERTAPQTPSLSCRRQHVYLMLTDIWHAQVFPPPGPARRMQWRRCSRACRSGMGRTTGLTRCAPGARSCCGTPASTTAKRVDLPTMAAGPGLREISGPDCHTPCIVLQLDRDLPICTLFQWLAEPTTVIIQLFGHTGAGTEGVVCCPIGCYSGKTNLLVSCPAACWNCR